MTLLLVMVALGALVPLTILLSHRRVNALGMATDAKLPVMLIGLMLLLSAGMYSQLGRFDDWQLAQVDERIDYGLAGRITEARRALNERPNDTLLMRELAGLYSEGSRYGDAADVWEQVRFVEGDKPELLTREAEARYYRDGRMLSQTSSALISHALLLDPYDLSSRLLLATAFYQAGELKAARGQWQWLLDSHAGELKRDAIERAIARVDARLSDNRVNP